MEDENTDTCVLIVPDARNAYISHIIIQPTVNRTSDKLGFCFYKYVRDGKHSNTQYSKPNYNNYNCLKLRNLHS